MCLCLYLLNEGCWIEFTHLEMALDQARELANTLSSSSPDGKGPRSDSGSAVSKTLLPYFCYEMQG
jgi:hypothetical protein